MALPMFDQGESLSMVVVAREEPGAFPADRLPEHVWLANLFGRMTAGLVLKEQMQSAYASLDYEMKLVADIQRSLLPRKLPSVPTLDLAAHYQTAHRAGGDYYDFFPYRRKMGRAHRGRERSRHAGSSADGDHPQHRSRGPPTAPCPPCSPTSTASWPSGATTEADAFVTAFYGVYDPATRRVDVQQRPQPPRLKRCGTARSRRWTRRDSCRWASTRTHSTSMRVTAPARRPDYLLHRRHHRGGQRARQAVRAGALDLVLHDCMLSASGLIAPCSTRSGIRRRRAADDRTLVVAKIS
jgi:sigma-B regulation protein RsbU (phosphoserine phosphatase)